MAHEISDITGVHEMFYINDEKPWHGLGTPVEEALTSEEAIQAAHLEWEVEKRKVYFKKDDGIFLETKAYSTVRTDVEFPLGIVSERYMTIQNREAFSFMDTLVGTKEAKFITAGALFNGEKIWMLCKIPGTLVIKGMDTVDKYLLLFNSHNGRSGCKVLITPIRVVCNNTLRIALQKAEVSVNIHHIGNIQHKVVEAQRILGITIDYYTQIEETFRTFAHREMTEDDIKYYMLSVIPGDSDYFKKIREKVHELHDIGIGSDMAAGTLWGAYNACVEFVDHQNVSRRRNPDRYIENITFGRGADIKTRAYEKALELVGVNI